jgi:hypothetical protein
MEMTKISPSWPSEPEELELRIERSSIRWAFLSIFGETQATVVLIWAATEWYSEVRWTYGSAQIKNWVLGVGLSKSD